MEYDVINENNVDELVKKVRAYIVGRKNMDLKEVKEFLDLAKEMKPNVKIGVEMIMSYAEELKPILDGLTKYMRSNTIEGIAFYEQWVLKRRGCLACG